MMEKGGIAKNNLHFHIPALRKRMYKIRPRSRYFIVHPPRARQLARAPRRRRLQRKQRHDVPRIRVEHLLVGRVCRAADVARARRPR